MIKVFADWLTYRIFNMTAGTHLADAVNFFIYDTIKIILMLTVIIYIVSIIRSFFPPEKVKNVLAGKSECTGNILASLLGIVTPFCSCSAVPVFIGFLEAGVPLGVTLSFLIASPMINEVALVLLWGLFGAKIALIYIGTGMAVAITAGFILGKIPAVEKMVERAREYVEDVKKKAGDSGVKAEALVREGDTYKVIIDLAKKLACEVIVMGSHGRTGVKRLLMGSVTEKVIGYSACPVLVIRG